MCKYHVVFVPKYRRKIIYAQYRQSLQYIIRLLCQYKGVEILEGHMMIFVSDVLYPAYSHKLHNFNKLFSSIIGGHNLAICYDTTDRFAFMNKS